MHGDGMRVRNVAGVAGLCAAIGVVGFLAGAEWSGSITKPILLAEMKQAGAAVRGEKLACKALVNAHVSEHRLGDRTVEAKSEAGTDVVSFQIAEDGKTLRMLTGADIRSGNLDSQPLEVWDASTTFIIAGRGGGLYSTAVLLDLENRNAVWSAISFPLGLYAESIYLECR